MNYRILWLSFKVNIYFTVSSTTDNELFSDVPLQNATNYNEFTSNKYVIVLMIVLLLFCICFFIYDVL